MSMLQMLLGSGGGIVQATGGTITEITGYKVHTFTTVGNDTFQIQSSPTATVNVEYLVVAGGAGGAEGVYGAGGGGAGGMRTGVFLLHLALIQSL